MSAAPAKRAVGPVGLRVEDRPLNLEEHALSETKKYCIFTAQQKTEIVLASLRFHKTHAQICRERDIADSLLRKWRAQFLAAGAERTEADELRQRVTKLERVGRKTMDVEIAGELLWGWE